ncbi:Hypothetical predicted protein [Pelobates cultripes]|uniref:Uncharacterized protein n=1 Tax=Pelobates cultripes TaxID=61616 RepID=A0AAD1T4P4_PELCU|nr:Hypothetical predicted protein [Pelobates cultripes]
MHSLLFIHYQLGVGGGLGPRESPAVNHSSKLLDTVKMIWVFVDVWWELWVCGCRKQEKCTGHFDSCSLQRTDYLPSSAHSQEPVLRRASGCQVHKLPRLATSPAATQHVSASRPQWYMFLYQCVRQVSCAIVLGDIVEDRPCNEAFLQAACGAYTGD